MPIFNPNWSLFMLDETILFNFNENKEVE